jgi:hypothetical protein
LKSDVRRSVRTLVSSFAIMRLTLRTGLAATHLRV